MADDGGYQVDPGELDTFAGYLDKTTHAEVTKAADGVQSANGFDNAAFGIFAAQLLAVPARIAMAVVHDNLTDLADQVAQAVKTTTATADSYRAHENSTAKSFDTIGKEQLG